MKKTVMKKTGVKALHLSRETLQDLGNQVSGAVWSNPTSCPVEKVCGISFGGPVTACC